MALNNLKKFAGHTKIKQAMLGFFVQSMYDDELFPDEQLESLARQIGFGSEFTEIVENL